MESEKQGWFGSYFTSGGPSRGGGNTKQTQSTEGLVPSVPSADNSSKSSPSTIGNASTNSTSLSTPWPMRKKRNASTGKPAGLPLETPPLAYDQRAAVREGHPIAEQTQSGAIMQLPSQMVEQVQRSAFAQFQPGPRQTSSECASIASSGGAITVVDEVRDVVRKLLEEFEQRFTSQLESRLSEMEQRHLSLQGQVDRVNSESRMSEMEQRQSSLQGQIDSLNSVVGASAMPMNMQQSYDVAERKGKSSANDSAMQGILSQLQRERVEAVHSLQSELAQLRHESPATMEARHESVGNELRLVAEIMDLRGNTISSTTGRDTRNGELMSLPHGAPAKQLQSGIISHLNMFEKSMRSNSNRPNDAAI